MENGMTDFLLGAGITIGGAFLMVKLGQQYSLQQETAQCVAQGGTPGTINKYGYLSNCMKGSVDLTQEQLNKTTGIYEVSTVNPGAGFSGPLGMILDHQLIVPAIAGLLMTRSIGGALGTAVGFGGMILMIASGIH